MKLQNILESINIAEELDKEQLVAIGKQVCEGFDIDLGSRKPWERDIEKWTELALQISKNKTYPWPNASNVKYPLLATAAMQFAARAYPSLVPSDGNIVKCQVVGSDMDGQKVMRAERISKHMSYQLMNDMEDWEEEMDKLLLALPIVGTMFKKTYWDATKQVNCSKLIYPKYLVVNYHARTLEDSERKTEILQGMYPRKVKEKQLQGVYLKDVKLPDPTQYDFGIKEVSRDTTQLSVMADDRDGTTPYQILEQHTFLDLDDDGYAEPYIVTVEYSSQTVLRIVARFSADGVHVNDKGDVTRIDPDEYYTKFSFVPNPDGGFYDIGFGRLLGTINASVDTIINQLIDGGTLSNLQAGFIGKGLRIKMGESKFSPGEWKAVNATGDDLKKQILPLPVNPPSPVLLQLLQYLVQSGRDLASVAEIMVGKMPGQNTPATTTMATIEQGMKVFTAVYKRIFRSLAKEFRKLYKLNAVYLDPQTEVAILDEPIEQSDYFGDPNDLIPAADPAAVSQQEKQAKAQMLLQLMGLGTLNPMAVTQYVLQAHEIPQPDQFIMQPQQQGPSPEQQQAQQEMQMKQQEMQMKAQVEQQKAQAKVQMDAAKLQMEMASEQEKMAMERAAREQDLKYKMIEHAMTARMNASNHQQNMQQADENHRAQLYQQYQKAEQAKKSQPKKESK